MNRQGDISLLPIKIRKKNFNYLDNKEILLQDSHWLQAEEILTKNSVIYALNPTLIHLPNTHPQISGTGWCKVIIGKRGNFYNFAAPTID